MCASGDADLLIVKTAVEATRKSDTVLVGDDTDLLVLLCFYYKMLAPHNLYSMPEPKKGSLLPRQKSWVKVFVNIRSSLMQFWVVTRHRGCSE